MDHPPQPSAPSLSELLKLAVDALTYALRMPRDWPARPRQPPPRDPHEHPH